MRIRPTAFSAAVATGPAAPPLSTANAQYYPQQRPPTAKGTTDQLLIRLQSSNGYSPYSYWPRVPRGDGVIHGDGAGVILAAPRRFHCFGRSA